MTTSRTVNSNAAIGLMARMVRSFANTISAGGIWPMAEPKPGIADLRYEIESDRLSAAIDDGLALIKHRDGADVLKQVSGDLLFELLTSIEYLRGGLPPSWRGVLKEIVAEQHAADAKIDAQLKRRARHGDGSKAIAA
jgi:hypothetical protein